MRAGGSPGGAVGTVSVGAPLGDALASLRTLRSALALGVLGGAALAAGLSLLVARRAVRPIRQISETAETIRSGDLGQRIGYRGRDELGALARVLDACFSELEEALERQRRFGADASHELKPRSLRSAPTSSSCAAGRPPSPRRETPRSRR